MDPTTETAVACARALAKDMGLRCEPVVIADRSNLVLHLAPHDIVARVAMATSAARVGMGWLAREVSVSRFLHEHGAWCTRPATRIAPGPHERDGYVVSFWEREHLTGSPPDPVRAGERLAVAHAVLKTFPENELPPWGAWTETADVMKRSAYTGILSPDERLRLVHAFEDANALVARAERESASMQAVHGDAHLGNVMATDRGELWTDWEDVFIGPVEWDLACLASRAVLFGEETDAIAVALSAYDGPHNPDLVRDLGVARNIQVIAWLAVFAERQPELLPRMRARLALLPA